MSLSTSHSFTRRGFPFAPLDIYPCARAKTLGSDPRSLCGSPYRDIIGAALYCVRGATYAVIMTLHGNCEPEALRTARGSRFASRRALLNPVIPNLLVETSIAANGQRCSTATPAFASARNGSSRGTQCHPRAAKYLRAKSFHAAADHALPHGLGAILQRRSPFTQARLLLSPILVALSTVAQ